MQTGLAFRGWSFLSPALLEAAEFAEKAQEGKK
jgi:hypothetical protein